MIRRPPRSTLFPTRRSSDLFRGNLLKPGTCNHKVSVNRGRRGDLIPSFRPLIRHALTKVHGTLVAEPFTRLAGQRVQSEEATIKSEEEKEFVQIDGRLLALD